MKDIPDFLIICTVRYSLGRTSYQVGETCQFIIENWSNLSEYCKMIIERDIEKAFKESERCLHNNKHPLGHDCDVRDWKAVRNLWKKDM